MHPGVYRLGVPMFFEVSLFFKRWCLDGVSEPPVVELRVSRLPEATQICSPNHPQSQLLNTRVLQHPTMAARTKYVPFVSPGLFRSDKNKEYQHRSILHRKHRGSVPSSAWGCTWVDDHRHPPRAEVMLSSLFLLSLWHYHQAVFHVSV